MHVSTDHQIEGILPTATAVRDQLAPGVRIRYGMGLYLSLDVAEAVDLVEVIIGALAELDAQSGGRH
ncbi:hypothetical protein ACGFIU_24870 [Rhodococcus oryzae]|uniref:hypothetical protein n=1 Tax=Rhodococcus oryzae TaxID=2571143 RepID=UPI00371B9C19